MLPRCMARTISIVGAGRVGRALGKRLRERGWRIGVVVTRSTSTARAAVRAIGGGTAFSRTTGDVLEADMILLGTPDDVLTTVVRALAKIGGSKCKGKVILHTSATLDRTVLASVARLGAATGSLHPMQAFGGKVIPKLKGVVFAIEGDHEARRMAQSIARSLGGIPVV
ncbi:MAG TPA: NAD(P)-binding domain-containing protein, partial [Verrucomicrobiae bacterium]|nr:NAD(P)-binding domain-containing protein [Verrucomicrobiae bacterium]